MKVKSVPLVTDCDGTLLRTDTLWVGFFSLLGQKPLAALKLPWLALLGPMALKGYLAEYSLENAEQLPDCRRITEMARLPEWMFRPRQARMGSRRQYLSNLLKEQ